MVCSDGWGYQSSNVLTVIVSGIVFKHPPGSANISIDQTTLLITASVYKGCGLNCSVIWTMFQHLLDVQMYHHIDKKLNIQNNNIK